MSSLPALPPDAPDARPQPAQVGPGRTSASVIGLALFGVVLGLGLDSRFGQSVESPTPESTVDVRPHSVSQRLQTAVFSTGGSFLVCAADAGIACSKTTATPSPHDYRDFTYFFSEAEWSAISSTTTRPGHLVVAALLGGVAASCILITLGTDAQPTDRVDITGVRPADEGGRYYFDLGIVEPGRYLFVIGAVQDAPSGGYRGATYLIALDVSS